MLEFVMDLCISNDGIKFHELQIGAYNAAGFVVFLEALANRFPEVQRGEVCLVMDNARITTRSPPATTLLSTGSVTFSCPHIPRI